MSLSNGVLPLNSPGPSMRFNDQYNGSNGWPDNGRSTYGDTSHSAWASSGVYVTFADGHGFTGTDGCNAANTGYNLMVSQFTGAGFPYTDGCQINLMSSFGSIAQTNTGGWTDGYTWKPSGIIYINDGQTATGLYLWVERQLDSSPFTSANPSLMYSPDGGTTWCAPGHSGAQCSVNGDPPAANTQMFTSSKECLLFFVQYEKNAAGTVNVDGETAYIYVFAEDNSGNRILMRAARGANLQSAVSWQFYTGAVGGNIAASGNWSSSDASATVIQTGGYEGQVVYIPYYGYIWVSYAASAPVFSIASQLTGPWTSAYSESEIGGGLYEFPALDLSSVSVSSQLPFSATAYIRFAGSYTLQTSNPATNNYSMFWRQLTFTGPPLASSIQGAVTLSGAVSIQ
jgi:hypothetical protein